MKKIIIIIAFAAAASADARLLCEGTAYGGAWVCVDPVTGCIAAVNGNDGAAAAVACPQNSPPARDDGAENGFIDTKKE